MQKLKLEDIDPNFAANELDNSEIEFFDITEEPFAVYGLYSAKQNSFKRMPTEIAKSVSEGVTRLHLQTSGGRIRFKTDSANIVVKSVLPELHVMKHMPLAGSAFFDLYVDGKFCKPFWPTVDFHDTLSAEKSAREGLLSVVKLKNSVMREIEINFPLYNSVDEVYIGLDKDAALLPGKEYIDDAPIVFYGSSITQGGCASHPGNAYPNIISRRLNRDFINLGFSGNCKAEQVMADYIASLDMSLFVYDYDHNASSVEFLSKTHEPLFKTIRKEHPSLPILMVSVADGSFKENTEARKAVIYRTYKNAIDSGDKNVYFLDGQKIYDVDADCCTVDGCHPNDLGFWRMANSIEKVIKEILL